MSEHAESALLDEFVLGTLDRRDALRVAEHLQTCAACRRECDELRSVVDILPQALPPVPTPPALRDRIRAAIDSPAPDRSAVAIARGLAAALLIAVAGDAFFALRLGQERTAVASATPAPAASVAAPRVRATVFLPPIRRATNAPRPLPDELAARERAVRDAATIARLKRELAIVQRKSRYDRGRVRLLESELAHARAVPRVVAVAPTPVAVTRPALTPKPNLPVAAETALPVPGDDALVAALRSGKVYAIDGAVDGEAWHLTILQPRDGGRAVIYSGTPDAPSGQTYRTWVVRDGRTVNAGELPPSKPATLQMPMALEDGDIVAFSREPIGAGDIPTQPFLMQLKIGQ